MQNGDRIKHPAFELKESGASSPNMSAGGIKPDLKSHSFTSVTTQKLVKNEIAMLRLENALLKP